MRQIEFRAWNGESMHYGGFSVHATGSIESTVFVGDIIDVMQFTGLHDKNGVKIFEGDIVQLYCSNWLNKVEVIKYSNGSFGYGGENIFTAFSCLQADMESGDHFTVAIKVIGNIHKNPELLEK